MTGIITSTFFVSLAGVSLMLGYKAWALAGAVHHTPSQHRFYREFSIKASEYYRLSQKIVRQIMLLVHEYLLSMLVSGLRATIKGLTHLHARLQGRLVTVTDMVKGRMRTPIVPENASVYLKDIAQHTKRAHRKTVTHQETQE